MRHEFTRSAFGQPSRGADGQLRFRSGMGERDSCGPSPYESPLAQIASWCHNGTMRRMNLRDVPDDVYAALVDAAEESRQSLSAFVVDRLSEVAQTVRVVDYVATYPEPRGTDVTVDDAVAAVREVREAAS